MATANTAIKITSLPNIGNNIAPSTLIPVVNMAGVPVTQKANLQITGNLILAGAGTANFVPAGLANLAYSVANSYQPNITRVGNLSINTFRVTGGTNGQYLQTDGTGTLAWVSGGGSGNGVVGGSTGQIQFNNAGNFGGSASLRWDQANSTLYATNFTASYALIYGNIDAINVNISSNLLPNAIYTDNYFYANGDPLVTSGNVPIANNSTPGIMALGNGFVLNGNNQVSTSNLYNTNLTQPTQHYTLNLDTNGVVHLPDQSIINGSTLRGVPGTGELNYTGITIGPNSGNPENTWMWVDASNAYIGTNYGANSHTWTFDADGNLTAPGNILMSNISGIYSTTAGYTVGLRMSNTEPSVKLVAHNHEWQFNSNGVLKFPIAYASEPTITMAESANLLIQGYKASGFSENGGNVIVSGGSAGDGGNNGNANIFGQQVTVQTQLSTDLGSPTYSWTFDSDGNITLPNGGGIRSAGGKGEGTMITGGNGNITSLTSYYSNGFYSGCVTANADGNVLITTYPGSGSNVWQFGVDGNLTLPANTFSINYANGTQVPLGGGGNANTGNVTFNNQAVVGTGSQYGDSGLYLAPGTDSVGNLQYLRVRGGDVATHIHLDTGNNQYFDQYFGDDYKYVKLDNTGNIEVRAHDFAGNTAQWTFGVDGSTIFPTLTTQRGDNPSGTITGQTLLFGDNSQEAIISTPDGNSSYNSSQRLVINPGQGYTGGEGGDIYLWAGRGGDASGSGGDIKIRGGQGGSNANGGIGGDGGYIRMEAGDAASTGGYPGYIDITGGYSNTVGGYVNVTGGQGATVGGDVKIYGGYGAATGGNVNIWGGSSGNGQSNEGHVNIETGGNTWTFAADGTTRFPNDTIKPGNGIPIGILTQSGNVYTQINQYPNNWEVYSEDDTTGANSGWAWIRADLPTVDTPQVFIETQKGSDGVPHRWTFNEDGNLTVPGNIVGPASANFVIYANAGVHEFTFGDDGTFYAPDNVVLGGTSVTIGPGANSLTGFENAVLVASSNSEAYVQAVINNVSDVGSADWVAYGHHGTDAGGWADVGFTSSGFNDANYTITKPGSGYVFAHGFDIATQPVVAGDGSLVLATGEQGNVKDIIFGTGGFLEANEFMRISDANNALELTRANSSIAFNGGTDGNISSDGNIKVIANSNIWTFGTDGNTTFPAGGKISNGYPGLAQDGSSWLITPSSGTGGLVSADGEQYIQINDNSDIYIGTGWPGNVREWTFGRDGNLTLPGNLVINGLTNVFGSNVALLESNPDLPLLSLSSGANAGVSSIWVEDIANVGSSNIAAVYTNPTAGSKLVRIAVGQNGGPGPKLWDFNSNGTTIFPGDLIGSGASPAPSISGFASANFTGNLSVIGNINAGNIITGTGTTGNITGANVISANTFIGNGSQLTGVATQTTGNWELVPGVNSANISVPLNGTYSIWVKGNIPNGIVTYTATAVVTNNNVPVLGSSYGWYYAAGNALVLTSIPTQFVGTVNNISNAVVSTTTANVFTFGITNNSGANAVVNWGYTKL